MTNDNIRNIIIPDISVNYNIKINSLYFLIREKTKEWFLSYEFFDKKKEVKYLKQDFTLFACLTYPHCNKEKLRNISDFYHWLWIIDDISEQYGSNVIEMECFFNNILDKDNNGKYSDSLYDIINRMKLSEKDEKDFINEINKYIKGTINRSNNVYNNKITIKQYLLVRRENSAVNIVFWHIKYCLNSLSKNIIEYNTEFKTLLNLFDDYISISNDILSFKKEYIDGDINIVIIMHKYYNYPIQKSIDESLKLLNDILKQFNEISKELSNINKYFKEVIIAMKYWISGYLIWTKNSPRYN